MDTNDPYFDLGDEETQVWVYITTPGVPQGYIKGVYSKPNLYQVDTIDARDSWMSEEILQDLAERLIENHIFFFVRIISTTNMVTEPNWRALTSVVSSEAPMEG